MMVIRIFQIFDLYTRSKDDYFMYQRYNQKETKRIVKFMAF